LNLGKGNKVKSISYEAPVKVIPAVKVPGAEKIPKPVKGFGAAVKTMKTATTKPASPYGSYSLVDKNIGGSTGSVKVKAPDGSGWIMKTAKGDKKWLANEKIGNSIYADLNPGSVPYAKVEKIAGKDALLVKEIKGAKPISEFIGDAAIRKEAQKGFVTDAWLGNWDSAGLSLDNMLVKDGKVIRIDQGGSLLYRAQGAKKGSAFGKTVGELKTLRDAKQNPAAAKLFADLTDADIISQIEDLEKTIEAKGGIDKFIAKHLIEPDVAGLPMAERAALSSTLKDRYMDLQATKYKMKISLVEQKTKETVKAIKAGKKSVEPVLTKVEKEIVSSPELKEVAEQAARSRRVVRTASELRAAAKETLQTELSFEERKAIRNYTGSAYQKINASALKANTKSKVVKDIQTGLEKMERYEGWVFRGVRDMPKVEEQFSKWKDGSWAHVEWKAFSSSSVDPASAFRASARGINYAIKSKGKNVGGYVGSISKTKGEDEYLFGRGSKFKVTGYSEYIHPKDPYYNRRYLILEELDDGEELPIRQTPPKKYDWDAFIATIKKEIK
jgi:hypothetical protein